jgi:hypothetical protein
MPVDIIHADFKMLPFDMDGRLEKEEYHRGMQLAVDSISIPDFLTPEKVLDLQAALSNEAYIRQYTWEPNDSEIRLLLDMVFL